MPYHHKLDAGFLLNSSSKIQPIIAMAPSRQFLAMVFSVSICAEICTDLSSADGV